MRGLLQQVSVLVVAAGLACAGGDAVAQGLQKLQGLPKSFSLPVADADVPAHEKACRHLARAQDYAKQSAELASNGNCRAIDGYFAATEAAWNAMWLCPDDPDLVREAAELYACSLQGLLESATAHGRLDCRGLLIGPEWGPIVVPIEMRGMQIPASAIEYVEATPPPGDKRIKRRHERGGFGLPVSVRVATPADREGNRVLAPKRQSLAATAVLRFMKPADENVLEAFSGPLARDHAPAILDLVNPMEIAAVDLGPSRPLLAADLTAPLLDMLGGMPANDNVMNFLQPYGSADTRPRLELLEPHRPGRVPVVFIHGLGSDEGTWFDLLNELRVRPWFLKRFEPWLFHYPTGASFLQTSAELRRQLTATVRRFDPEGKDPAMQHLILVGHSMGGLHAKLQVVEPGTALWDSIACVPFNEVRMRSSIRRQVAPGYFFKPLPFVNRVVYIATPHAGSSLASLAVGRVASATVQQPEESLAIHREVLGGNPGAFHSDYVRAPPTTVDILEPKSRILQALHGLRPSCRVTMHSIIGNGITWPLSGPGDNVVPVTSARLPGVVSEVYVPSVHTELHHHPITVFEMERILDDHLRENGL